LKRGEKQNMVLSSTGGGGGGTEKKDSSWTCEYEGLWPELKIERMGKVYQTPKTKKIMGKTRVLGVKKTNSCRKRTKNQPKEKVPTKRQKEEKNLRDR